jgi:hypothetical protein
VKKIVLFIFLTTCTNSQLNSNFKNDIIDFKKSTTFEDFKKKLENYSINTPYPDIDKNL